MIINWFGQSCFKIQGNQTTLVTDPFNQAYGLKVPRLAADIVTISHDHGDHNNHQAVKGSGDSAPFVVSRPGEYEVKGTFIYGIPSYHDNQVGKERGDNVIYRIELDGISLAHLGDLGHSLDNGLVEQLEGVDILFVPVGGTFTIDAQQATQMISQLEPRIVIPMHYHIPDLKFTGGKKIDGVGKFCKELGVTSEAPQEKLKISKKDLPQEKLQVVILQA
jgi:L-ascorbate metabolism protein UlaG (beta-lactamase superfamily)